MSPNGYQHLEARPGSSIRQPWVKGRNIWAEVLYRETVGEDARTPEQVARDFEVPLGAVLEAVDFCTQNQAFLQAERDKERILVEEFDSRFPPLRPPTVQPG